MIRIDAAWLATAPLDMRAGTDTALARVITTFGAAHPHYAYVFANQRAGCIRASSPARRRVRKVRTVASIGRDQG
jgi:hypothetical protein